MKAVVDAPEDAHNGKHDALHDEQSTGNGALIDAGVRGETPNGSHDKSQNRNELDEEHHHALGNGKRNGVFRQIFHGAAGSGGSLHSVIIQNRCYALVLNCCAGGLDIGTNSFRVPRLYIFCIGFIEHHKRSPPYKTDGSSKKCFYLADIFPHFFLYTE